MSTKVITDKDLSIDISTDAASDIKAVTPKAVVDYVTAQNGITVDKTGGEGFTKVGVNNETPSVALDVVGDVYLAKDETYSQGLISTDKSQGKVFIGDRTYIDNGTLVIVDEFEGKILLQKSYLNFSLYGKSDGISSGLPPITNLQVDAEGNVIESKGFTGDVIAGQTMTFENGILKTVA